jgi:molecular chaperone GrpE
MGIERIKTVGEAFNPHFHEAITADEGVEIITQEVQAGYKLDDYVIRHAQVKLIKKI